ncbi:MAG: protein kinase [Myxococcota bacterium]
MSEEAARPESPVLPRCPHCGEDHPPHLLKCPNTDLALPLEGRILHGKFRFVRQLGKGGMAAVWSAINTLVDRRVAIKLIRPDAGRDEETVARFRAEAKAAGRIGHRNVCEILDFGLGPVGPYIVMERLQGHNLGELIHREQRLDPALAVTIVRQALAGLEAAHRAGIIHRDLKPENLFLHQPEGGPPVVKIMDFGVSKLTDGSSEVVTGHGALLGTPEYMSPEQFKGAARSSVQTDIWAMGAILYKALTGQTAFGGPSVAGTLLMVTTEEPTPIVELVRGVPPELVEIVERCLRKDPAERFESAAVMAEELEPFDLETLDGLALPTSDSEPDVPAAPTVDVTPRRSSGPSSQASAHGESSESQTDTLLPTTRRQLAGPERRPSRPDRRAWLLIGAVTVIGAGLVYMLTRGPPSPSPAMVTASTTPPLDARPRNLVDLGATAPTATGGAATSEPTTTADTGELVGATSRSTPTTSMEGTEASTTGGGSTGGGSTGGDDPSTGALLLVEDTSTTGDADATGNGQDSAGSKRDSKPSRRPPATSNGGSAPATEPSEPLPTPPGTIRVERYLTPKKPGPMSTHAEARAYCKGLARQSFAGVSSWKLASPIVARKLTHAARRGKYWTAALWQGKAIVISLPSTKQDSRASKKSGPRALCAAKWP